MATLKSNGDLEWVRNFRLSLNFCFRFVNFKNRVKTSCSVNIRNFPYDSQTCPLTFASMDNSNEFLQLRTIRWNHINNVTIGQRNVEPNSTINFEGQRTNMRYKCCNYTV